MTVVPANLSKYLMNVGFFILNHPSKQVKWQQNQNFAKVTYCCMIIEHFLPVRSDNF